MKTANASTTPSQAASTSQLAWLLVGDVADILDDGLDTENLRWLVPVLESLWRTMDTEEQQDGECGYMNDVLDLSPNSYGKVESLHRLRDELREELHEIIDRIRQTLPLESLSEPMEQFLARTLSTQLMSWVDRMTTHHGAERELCQSVWYMELGVGD